MGKETITVKVDGMTCGHCKMTVTEAIQGVKGVTSADVDLDAGTALITRKVGKASDADIEAAITAAGYQVTTG